MEQKILKLLGVKGTFKNDVIPMMNYSSANITTSGAGYVVSLYYMKFLTDVVNLPLEWAGLVTTIAVVWDAITDPIMGVITDRTRSKYGKHRRYILWGMPLLCLSFVMMWNGYGFDGRTEPVKTFIYFTIAYMLYKTAYTIIDIPHVAMLPELAPDYDLRIQYNSVGYIFNSFGMFPSFFLVSAILGCFGFGTPQAGAQKPMLISGIVLAVVYGICLYITFKRTREKPSLDLQVEKFDLKFLLKEYAYVVKNKSFREYFFMSLCYNIANYFYTTTLIYYIEYVAKLPSWYTLFTTVAGAFEAASFPLNYALTIKFGKKKCGAIVTPLMLAGFVVCLFMNPTAENEGAIIWKIILMATAVLYPFGKSGLGYVATNILPDISDVDELITGRRREGVIGTFNTFIKKTVSGVMSSVVMFILGGFGLVVGDELQEKLAVDPGFHQSDSALLGVRICITFAPIVFTLISLVLLHTFKMTKKEHTLIRAAIATKHKYGSVALSDEEIRIMEKISGQKYENTWLGRDNDSAQAHAIELNENGEYQILIEIEEEMKKIRTSKEGKKAEKEALEQVKAAVSEDE
ncbi:MAG: MFS transporter [Clostridia bacterium]|nr:MFS transporter [Clostridia bacterium]